MPSWNSLRTVWPGAFGAIMNTSTSFGGTIWPKWMLKPCANAMALPSVRYGSMSFLYISAWRSSGIRIMMMSDNS